MTTAPAASPATTTQGPQPRPGHTPHAPDSDQPNPLFDRLLASKTPSDWAIRIVLSLVMTAALAVGTWSIYTLLTEQFHAPQAIAFLGCGMFDVAALFFALLSQQYAVTTDSGLAPRLAMLAMICTSSWVNWQHGAMEGWGVVGSVILAAAPVIAELAFEMFHRYAHREALRRLGRVAQSLPVLGKWAWIVHPGRSRKTLDAHIKAALTEHEAVAERREELATERARQIVTLPVQVQVHAEPEPVREPALPTVTRTAEPVTAIDPVREPLVNHEPEPVNQVHEPAPDVVNPEPRTAPQPKKTTNREPANLGDRAATKRTQIDQVLNLIDELGYDATTLGVVRDRTGMTKTTAYNRLIEARAEWQQTKAS